MRLTTLFRLACLLAGAVVAYAQPTTSQITGVITDNSSAVVMDAKVTATNVDTGITYPAASNEVGLYTIPLLPPGNYRIQVQKDGFRPISRSGITLQVNSSARVDFRLEVGAVTETVNVEAAAPLVDTTSGTVGQVVDNKKVTQLPLNGRNIYGLTLLVPGAAPDHTGRTRINGARARSNEYLVDGVTQVSPETRGDPILPPPVDSVLEFKVVTSSYSAEYGNASGGIVNVATRSGTNEFHGTFWEFLRNDALNTRNFFAPPNQRKPVLRYNQFGAAGGGPVLLPGLYNGRNRTFFFADYEGVRVREQRVFNVSVPTAAMRAGDFSAFYGSATFADPQGNTIRQGQIFDPQSTRTVNGQIVRDPFPNNQIPRSRFDPAATRILSLWPDPTSAALNQNFLRATSTGRNDGRWDARVDHEITSGNRVFGRYSDFRRDSLPTFAFPGSAGHNDINENKQRTVTSSWISTLRPTWLNEFRFALLHNLGDRRPYRYDTNVASELGIQGITTTSGLPFIDISGVEPVGSNFSGGFQQGDQKVYSLVDHMSLITGRHSLKFGAEIRLYRLENFQPSLLNGLFAFRALQTSLPGANQARTGNAFASFLLGAAHQTQYTQKDPGQIVNNETYAFFVQDDFKITSRLTLNFGLRYELNTRLQDARGFHSTFDLASGRVLAGAAKPDVPLDRNNFAPRFSFAYDLTGQQRTVLRGGYGIFHQAIQGAGGNPLAGVVKFPFEFTSNAVSPNDYDPVTTLTRGPVVQPEYNPDDPRLGFGTNVLVQNSNLAPYVQMWNLGIEQSLWGGSMFGVSYVGSAGKKHEIGRLGYIDLNQVPFDVVREAARVQGTLNPATQQLRPYPNFNLVQLMLPRLGNSNYHSLQSRAEQRLRNGVTLLVSYTWSKAIDNGPETFGFTGGTFPQDIYNLSLERAVSEADVPHRFVASYVWDLPFGRGRQFPLSGVWNAIAGGWQLSGVTTLQSGRPFDITQTTNTTRTFSLTQRPNISGAPMLSGDERTLNRFFNTGVFSPADPLSVGTSPRNPVRGPGRVNFDAALIKEFPIMETRLVEFRFETFNFTNTPPFNNPVATYNPSLPLASQNFGRITSAGDGRVIQLALKLRL